MGHEFGMRGTARVNASAAAVRHSVVRQEPVVIAALLIDLTTFVYSQHSFPHPAPFFTRPG